ncbi:MAG: DinB family protein [Ignavibacteria bacterium]|nr:DinB family protein [Ignavibacteria bacterium]
MDTSYIIDELERNKSVFKSLLENLPPEIYLRRMSEGKWNLLEILCHLYDEEREDFRARVFSVLENPEANLSPIDPQGWVSSRNYASQNYNDKLNDFLEERSHSLKMLRELKNPKWENIHIHPKLGAVSAKMFFVNWLAHDYLHIRQITKLKYEFLKASEGESLSYAGEW